jgi:hypothetical protein
MNTDEQQTFADNEKIKRESDETRLGNVLNTKANINQQIAQQIKEVNKTRWEPRDY